MGNAGVVEKIEVIDNENTEIINQEETEEDFFDEDYEDIQHAVIVLENYIH